MQGTNDQNSLYSKLLHTSRLGLSGSPPTFTSISTHNSPYHVISTVLQNSVQVLVMASFTNPLSVSIVYKVLTHFSPDITHPRKSDFHL